MLKKILIASALAALPLVAQASDLPSKTAPAKAPVMAKAYDWTGFYVGVNGGYGFGHDVQSDSQWADNYPDFSSSSDLNNSVSSDGWNFGGQLGYNFQQGNVVFGIETDLQWADQKSSWVPDPSSGSPSIDEVNVDYFGTVRGRLGFAAEKLFIYGTGGLAYGSVKTSVSNLWGSEPTLTNTTNSVGWTAGAGAEFAIDKNWSIKAEYLYVDLGSHTDTFEDADHHAQQSKYDSQFSVVRAGLNYRF